MYHFIYENVTITCTATPAVRELTSTYLRKEGGAPRSGPFQGSVRSYQYAADGFREKLNAHACCGVGE